MANPHDERGDGTRQGATGGPQGGTPRSAAALVREVIHTLRTEWRAVILAVLGALVGLLSAQLFDASDDIETVGAVLGAAAGAWLKAIADRFAWGDRTLTSVAVVLGVLGMPKARSALLRHAGAAVSAMTFVLLKGCLMLRFRHAVATALGAAVLVPASAGAAPPAVVLDPIAPIDVAAYSGSLAWLRPDPPPASNDEAGASKHAKLVIRSNGTVTVLATKVPAKTAALAFGSGTRDELCVVLVTPAGLATVSLAHPAKPRLVPGTRPGDHAPGLRHGVLSYARRIKGVETLQLGSLRSSDRHLVFTAARGADIVDTTIGARQRIAVQTVKTDASGTTRYQLSSISRGRTARKLIALAASEGGDNADIQGMGRATLGTDGTRISVSRYTAIGPNDTTDFSLRDGRKLSSHRNNRLPFHYVELPLGREGAAAVTVAGRDDGEDQPSDWALHLLPR